MDHGQRPGDLPPLSHGLAYAVMGWPVFPCVPGGKEPATRHGFHDATTDPDQIEAWWRRWPAANVAIATGAPGPDVLDFDVKDGAPGLATYRRLRDAGLLRGAFAYVWTPSGGRHLYYVGTEQGCGTVRGHGVDFKARGGYVVAPPSRTGDGVYQMRGHRWVEAEADWPAIRALLSPPARLPTSGIKLGDHGALVRFVEGLEPGNRNNGLHWAASKAAQSGAEHSAFAELARAAAAAGLGDAEIRRTIESARRSR